MSLVTIASFTDAHTAYLAKARLEAEGIPVFVADDALVQMNWLYSGAIGGVKVQVDESDEQDATRILNEDHRAELASNEEAGLESTLGYAKQDLSDVVRAAWPAIVLIAVFIGLTYFVSRRYSGF